jgi:DTW domain-containing protein YfiP
VRPLFILLMRPDRSTKDISQEPYFDRLPILSLLPEKLSRYRTGST